jgi:hypothetical protein
LSARNAGQTGLNRTTQAVSSTSTWYAFAGHVKCRAYRIADNRAGEEARWDDKLLKLEISELGVLAELTGLDPKEMGRLGLAEDAAQDPIPAPPASPVARLGQIWQLGKHRLLCGDSTRPEHVSRLMGDERAILFATDPPYAIGYAGGSHPATRANRAKANRDKDWSKVYHEAGRTAPKPTAIRTGRRSTTKPAEPRSRTRTPAAIAGDRSISLFTKSRSSARSRPTQHGTAGTRPPGNRCLRASGTKSAHFTISKSSGSRAAPS